MTVFPPPPEMCEVKEGHGWEVGVGGFLTRLISGPGQVGAHRRGARRHGRLGLLHQPDELEGQPGGWRQAGEENDYMPGVEKGINYARAAFKGSSDTWKDLVRAERDHAGRHLGRSPDPRQGADLSGCIDESFPGRDLRHRGSDREGPACAQAQRPGWAAGIPTPAAPRASSTRVELHADHRKDGKLDARPRVHRLYGLLCPVRAPGQHAADGRAGRTHQAQRSARYRPRTTCSPSTRTTTAARPRSCRCTTACSRP